MFEVGVNAAFHARHQLVGADFGPEGSLHGHDYRVQVVIAAERLGPHELLVDIRDVRAALEACLERYAGAVLNDLPELAALNPSLEAFARAFCRTFVEHLPGDVGGRARVKVTLWESDDAWASFTALPAV